MTISILFLFYYHTFKSLITIRTQLKDYGDLISVSAMRNVLNTLCKLFSIRKGNQLQIPGQSRHWSSTQSIDLLKCSTHVSIKKWTFNDVDADTLRFFSFSCNMFVATYAFLFQYNLVHHSHWIDKIPFYCPCVFRITLLVFFLLFHFMFILFQNLILDQI